MKSMINKILYNLFFICICSKAVSQDEMSMYCGVWKRMYSDEIFIRNSHKTDTLRQPCGNDEPIRLFIADGKGYYITANQRKENFLWSVKDSIFTYKDSISDAIKIIVSIRSNQSYDILTLKHSYKRKMYNYIEYLSREKIKLMPLDDIPQTKWNKKDTEFAYKNRIIEDQIPRVTFGYYDDKKHILHIELTFYEYILTPRQYDNLELFVIGNTKETKNKISSFLISYSSQNDTIINISKIKDYYEDRFYDKVDSWN